MVATLEGVVAVATKDDFIGAASVNTVVALATIEDVVAAATTNDLGGLGALRVVRLLPITIRSTTIWIPVAGFLAAGFPAARFLDAVDQ